MNKYIAENNQFWMVFLIVKLYMELILILSAVNGILGKVA